MQRITWIVALVSATLLTGCARKPAESTAGSTETTQPIPNSTVTGTTATETGGGPPVSTTTANATTATTGTH